ncbi:MAG: hypothetical protein LIP05_00395 [Tannerellaceae bacterium]|nr:hypothetical protein [Tannerellaceae bacterium]MCC8197502.1 hypothetical protein [Tannerellaceae bacterium]
MKRINISTAVLLIYLIVMAIFGWPGNKPDPDYIQYGVIIGASVIVIIVLRIVQIKRLKAREKWKQDK